MTAERYIPTEALKQAVRGHRGLTVVQDARGRPLTKSFRRLGDRIVKGSYPHASEFRAYVVEVGGITSLAAVTTKLSARGLEVGDASGKS